MKSSEVAPPAELRRLRALDPRPYAWDRNALVERACPVCAGESRAMFVRPDELVLHRCGSCATYFVSPAPDDGQLRKLYHAYHDRQRVAAFRGTKWHHRSELPTMAEPSALLAHLRGRRALDDLRIQELATMMEFRGATVLDIGCGSGAFLAALESLGARGTGLDIDAVAVNFAREQLKLADVRCGEIDALSTDQNFDLVVLQDILEHVLAPRELFERAAAHVRSGGLLYLWTPNATFIEREREPLMFRADFEHLQFFSTRAVERLARQARLDIVHLETLGELGVIDDEVGPTSAPRRSLKRWLKRLPFFERLNDVRRELARARSERTGTYHLFAVLRKPDDA